MYKKFLSYYKNHLGLFTLDMSCAILIAFIDLIIPFLVKIFIDDYIPNANVDMMVKFSIVLIVLAIAVLFLNFIVAYFGHMMGTKIERDMRKDLYFHVQKMDVRFFTESQIGNLMSRLVGDLRDISEFSHHGPEDLFISSVMLIGSFIILLRINVTLTIILFIITAVMLLFTISRRQRMTRAFRSTREYQADLNSQIENSLSGITVTKSYTNEKFEKERFNESNIAYQRSWVGAYFEMGIFTAFMNFMLKLMVIIVIIIGGYLAYNDQLSVGELAAYILYVSFFAAPIRRLVSFFDQYQKGWSGFTRFYNMILKEDDVKSGDIKFEGIKEKIEFKNASFKYEDNDVFTNFNLTVPKNSSIALVGKTGVGKSTIAKMIPRFYDVNEGEILLDNINIKEFDLISLRSKIGYVEQDSYIFFGTIYENIIYGRPDATKEEVMKAAEYASLDEFVSSLPLGYDTEVGGRGIKLSGGQKQRISLARMFLKNPDIIVLDEATSALDNKTEIMIQESIERLSKDRTSIIIAHRLTTIESCDLIYLLSEEGIAESGTHEELMLKKGLYYDMYTSAIKNDNFMV